MAVWTDDRKCMLVWRSGFQYHAAISSPKPLDLVALIVREFYQHRDAVLQEDASNAHSNTFSRGRERVRFFGFPTLSETQLRQTIVVSTAQEGGATLVKVCYDVHSVPSSCILIVAPNALVKEVRELRLLLQSE